MRLIPEINIREYIIGINKYLKRPKNKKNNRINMPYLSNWKNCILRLYGKKLASIFDPSKGGIGNKLKKAKSKLKKQNIIAIKNIEAKKSPCTRTRMLEKSP